MENERVAEIVAAILLLAAIIARQLVRPIATLTSGTRALTAGDFERRITVTRNDELGDLARDFNQLAQTLGKNQQSRRQWVSDISHELRTPLAILSGELQAIEDGVRTFDDGMRKSLQAEVQRLGNLVNDLHELTISDEGGLRCRHELTNVVYLLQDTIEANRARIDTAGLALQATLPDAALYVDGDPIRLDQLFSNLIENSICREVRAFSRVPIIVVTARVEEIDRLLGLELGADDYVCKPFSNREVVARVKAILRCVAAAPTNDFSAYRNLRTDAATFVASVDGRTLNLTPVEFRLLTLLSKQPSRVFSRDKLIDSIYLDGRIVSDRTIDSHVKNLRRKLVAATGDEDWIRSIYGVGYRHDQSGT